MLLNRYHGLVLFVILIRDFNSNKVDGQIGEHYFSLFSSKRICIKRFSLSLSHTHCHLRQFPQLTQGSRGLHENSGNQRSKNNDNCYWRYGGGDGVDDRYEEEKDNDNENKNNNEEKQHLRERTVIQKKT